MTVRFCEVALPLPLRTTFTYRVPESLAETAVPGQRVVVPFRNRAMVGALLELTGRAPSTPKVKDLIEVLDPIPALSPRLLELGRWLAGYYLVPVGEVFRAMLPPMVEVRRDQEFTITVSGAAYRAELKSLGNRSEVQVTDLALLDLLEIEGKPVRCDRARNLPGGEAAAARLLRLGYIQMREVARRRQARLQRIVAWNPSAPPFAGKDALGAAAESAERIRRTLAVERGPMPFKQLLASAGVKRAQVDRLIKQGVLEEWPEALAAEDDLFEIDFTPPANVLNADQERAVGEICGWLDAGEFATGLLHGVTGSGKTEVYLRVIEHDLARNRTALVLVPEIALTLWVGRLCRAWFADAGVAVLHSALGDVERAREWWRVRRGEARVVVGTRSAVFAPLENLGLVIVDEEQESSYKQEESPRYHGRDTAVMRAKLEGAVALLGSATPSLESFQNARTGKYHLLELTARVENRPLAAVEVVDLREEFLRTRKAGAISERLRAAIGERLDAGTQALLLINRRGYSWFALCRSCGTTAQCANCSISLTYHKQRNRMVCHYCGYSCSVSKSCLKCGSQYVYFVGQGAEQLEERLRELFPRARIGRLDRDTARTKREFQKVLSAFASGKLDLLVGTQMVAKGHDFQCVTLVGVVSTDTALGLPDFRAAERTFELLTQVAGRAGRGDLPGTVLVETYYPEHYAIQQAARQNYAEFFERELHFRRLMHYPPFTALASILIRDAKLENAIRWSRQIAAFLAPAEARGVRVLGPAVAPRARLKREYRFQFLLKSPKRAELTRILAGCLDSCAKAEIPDRAVVVDVDPQNLL